MGAKDGSAASRSAGTRARGEGERNVSGRARDGRAGFDAARGPTPRGFRGADRAFARTLLARLVVLVHLLLEDDAVGVTHGARGGVVVSGTPAETMRCIRPTRERRRRASEPSRARRRGDAFAGGIDAEPASVGRGARVDGCARRHTALARDTSDAARRGETAPRRAFSPHERRNFFFHAVGDAATLDASDGRSTRRVRLYVSRARYDTLIPTRVCSAPE